MENEKQVAPIPYSNRKCGAKRPATNNLHVRHGGGAGSSAGGRKNDPKTQSVPAAKRRRKNVTLGGAKLAKRQSPPSFTVNLQQDDHLRVVDLLQVERAPPGRFGGTYVTLTYPPSAPGRPTNPANAGIRQKS